MKIKQIIESTTSGAVATVAAPIGGTQKRAGSMFTGKKTNKPFYEDGTDVKGLEPAEKVIKGKAKKKGPYANSIVESKMKELAYDIQHLDAGNFKKKYGHDKEYYTSTLGKPPVSEAEITEHDLILNPKQLIRKDKSFVSHENDRRDHEVEMARTDLYATAKNAMKIYQLLKDRSEDEGLMGWQQSYITLAADYLNSVAESIEHDSVKNEGGGVIAGGMSNFEEDAVDEARKDQYTTRIDDEGNVVKVYPPSGPKSRKAQIKALTRNFGSTHIGKHGESPKGDKVGKGANIKGSAVAKLSGGMSVHEDHTESKCPHCGGELVSEDMMNEKKDACYYKVKSRYKVWPSAYASGALVKCRKKGASNWGKSKK